MLQASAGLPIKHFSTGSELLEGPVHGDEVRRVATSLQRADRGVGLHRHDPQ